MTFFKNFWLVTHIWRTTQVLPLNLEEHQTIHQGMRALKNDHLVLSLMSNVMLQTNSNRKMGSTKISRQKFIILKVIFYCHPYDGTANHKITAQGISQSQGRRRAWVHGVRDSGIEKMTSEFRYGITIRSRIMRLRQIFRDYP